MSQFNPTAAEVKAYREEHGWGLNETRRLLKKRNMMNAATHALEWGDLETLGHIIIELLKEY